MHLLLASKSPRRRELLAQMGLPFSTVDIDVEEHIATPLPASQVAESLALLKAGGYKPQLAEGEVLVTADTVVVHQDQVLGKPTIERKRWQCCSRFQDAFIRSTPGFVCAVVLARSVSQSAHRCISGICRLVR